jgi:hypothetical protein
VQNGAYVTAKQLLADVYRDDTNENKRERAAQLQAEIEQLETALAVGNRWQTAYTAPYVELMRKLSQGDLRDAAENAAETSAALGGRDAASAEEAAALLQQIDALKLQLHELIRHVNDPLCVSAASEGVFYRTADGYEAAFSPDAVATLTPDTLTALLATPQADANVIGRIADCGTLYLAIPTTTELASTYEVQREYTVRFSGGTQRMTLTSIRPDSDGSRSLLILRADRMPDFPLDERIQNVTLEKQTLTGLSVPSAAVVDESFVYVLDASGTARLKKITPLMQKNGVLLVQPKNADGELNENDTIILNTDKVYDGKVLS